MPRLATDQPVSEPDHGDRYTWKEGDIEILHVGTEPAPPPAEEDDDSDIEEIDPDEVGMPTATVHVYEA